MSVELPWIEKYRPKDLNDVVGQDAIIRRLKGFAESRTMPHMLFAGPAGTGKTSSALALARELFGNSYGQNFLELNASDERGIDVVRNKIKDFARTLAFNSEFKIIFLDEADALTADAQHALRRTMEKFTKTARFILSCNYSSRIIEPVQSRCILFRFTPLEESEIKNKIKEIAKKEKINLEEKAVEAIVYVSEKDLRKAINVLQASSMQEGAVTEKMIFEIASRAKPEEIKKMIELALKKDFKKAREMLFQLMFEYGMSGEDIIMQLYKEAMEMDETVLGSREKSELINVIAEYDFRLTEGANERIQIESLLAQIMKFGK